MTSPTPGPWRVPEYAWWQIVEKGALPGHTIIAQCYESGWPMRSTEEAKANARLMAASPALAEALADFVQERGECMGDPEWTGPGCAYYSFGKGEPCPWCKGMAALDSAGLLNPETGEPI